MDSTILSVGALLDTACCLESANQFLSRNAILVRGQPGMRKNLKVWGDVKSMKCS